MWPTSVSRAEGAEPAPGLNRRGWIIAGVGLAALTVAAVLAAWLSAAAGRPTTPVYDSSSPAMARTWTWDGSDFAVQPATGPGPSSSAADMAYDRRSGAVVLWDHGCGRLVMGFTGGCQSQVNQTWTWDGRSWARHKQGSGPSAVGQGAMVYDGGLGQVLYVNRRGEAWAWTGAAWQVVARNGAPHLAEPGSQANPELSLVAAGYDEKLQKLVLALPSTTWSWDGRSWSQVSGGIDAADGQADPRAVGAGALGQLAYLGSRFLWTWDGSRWQSRPQPAGGAGTLGYDPTRGKLVAVRQDDSACDRTACPMRVWTWDGTAWSAPRVAHQPLLPLTRSGAVNPPLAFDEARQVLVLFVSGN